MPRSSALAFATGKAAMRQMRDEGADGLAREARDEAGDAGRGERRRRRVNDPNGWPAPCTGPQRRHWTRFPRVGGCAFGALLVMERQAQPRRVLRTCNR